MRARNRTNSNRETRHLRIRRRLQGDPERPRLSIYPSIKHLEAQIIDDFGGRTLIGLTTKAKAFQKGSGLKTFGNVQAAERFGQFVAERAREKGIQKVVFDRGGFLYHGRIKAFADAARKQGLLF
jgi:large subunit ribosomal protein L18